MNDSQYLMIYYYQYKKKLSEKKKIHYMDMQEEKQKMKKQIKFKSLDKNQFTWYSAFSPNNKILQPSSGNNINNE